MRARHMRGTRARAQWEKSDTAYVDINVYAIRTRLQWVKTSVRSVRMVFRYTHPIGESASLAAKF